MLQGRCKLSAIELALIVEAPPVLANLFAKVYIYDEITKFLGYSARKCDEWTEQREKKDKFTWILPSRDVSKSMAMKSRIMR